MSSFVATTTNDPRFSRKTVSSAEDNPFEAEESHTQLWRTGFGLETLPEERAAPESCACIDCTLARLSEAGD